jgi:scyllo-inositol 2-dehydrogenase (NADP+)
MSTSIETVIVGYGLGGRVFHAPFISAVPGLHLNGIVQRKGDEAAKAYPNTRIFRSIEEALGDKAVQLVVVSTPNETHFDLARKSIEAGKHMVIDKPFAANSDEARQLVDLAKKHSVVLAPFHNRRWDGDFLTVRKIVDSGALGRVVTFESHFDRFRPLPRENSWKEAESSANGLLMDLGPHLVDQALALFGVPEAITASVRRDRDQTAIEDAFDITLHYPHLLASCRSSMLACDASPRFLLHGTLGSFKKFGLDPQEPALIAGEKVPPVGMGDWLSEDQSAWGTLTVAPDPSVPGTLTRTVIETERGDYRNFYASVRDAINGDAPLAVPTEEGYRVVKLLEMARQSSNEGRTLPVSF